MQTTTAWRAYVINLDQAKARWSYITRQLIDLGIPYARVEAVDGNSHAERADDGWFRLYVTVPERRP